MKKKYIIHDEDGQEYKIEETVEEQRDEDIDEAVEVEAKDDALTEEEIAALKRLASMADKLIELVGSESDEVVDEDEEAEPIEEEEVESEEEEVIDTDCGMTRDSKASFNSIEKRSKKVDDSIDPDEDVNKAWAKRYNGGK